uniref:Holliday junction branch migration protein RuvA n=1 Tax=Ndongobacter massiliensis TaxID=1871025 RepID=UPI000931D91F|nr:Holliday junction branch migration protein RuvA [Ndongobacter massiliensis]
MYAYIIGEVQGVEDGELILENNGIGYRIATSQQSMSHFQVGGRYKVYVLLNVREDALSLYGFATKEEKEMFLLLTKVTAVGPKAAFSLLSTLTVDALRQAILQSDVEALVQAPGIGKKTASRILLELLDPIEKAGYVAHKPVSVRSSDERQVALEALVNLGYQRAEAQEALGRVDDFENLESLIRLALRELS